MWLDEADLLRSVFLTLVILDQLATMRLHLSELWQAVHDNAGTDAEFTSRQAHRRCNREIQRFKLKARGRFVKSICHEVEQHMRNHDLGKFFSSLKKLGIQLAGKSSAGQVRHSPDQLRAHCRSVSSVVRPVGDDLLSDVPVLPCASWLGQVPTQEEVCIAAAALRDCSPGKGEVTVHVAHSCIRVGLLG